MVIFDFVWALIIGLVVGSLAKFIMPGKDPGGCIITSLLGICGSIVAAFLFSLLGLEAPGGFMKFIAAIVGAVIILAIYRAIIGRKSG